VWWDAGHFLSEDEGVAVVSMERTSSIHLKNIEFLVAI
jgi:hypothetical protein